MKFLSMAAVGTALVVGTIFVYWGVLSSDFVDYDDKQYVYQNQNVLKGLSSAGFQYAWTTSDCGNWHPLTWLSLQLDASIWGHNPVGFHATNLFFHALNSVLVFAVLYRLTFVFGRSVLVAALFALHPLHVESVAWVSERKDVLSTTFLLLTILAYSWHAKQPSIARYVLVMLLLSLGLLVKSMLVTLPVLLLLIDIWPLNRIEGFSLADVAAPVVRRPFRRLCIEKIPFLCIAFIDGLATISSQKVDRATLRDIELPTRIANAFHAYAWYLQKTFVPTDLIVIYPHPEQDLPWRSVLIGVFVVLGITFFAIWRNRTARHLLFGWAWFVVSLLPVIGLIQVGGQAFADRYVYIPHIGLFTAIVWEVYAQFKILIRSATIPTGLIGVAAVLACGIMTTTQVGYWKNSSTLWNHAYSVDPGNYITHDHLAELYYTQHQFDRAAEHFEIALQNKRMKSNADAFCAWGWCLSELNRRDEAEDKYRMALKINRNHQTAMVLLRDLQNKREQNPVKF